MTHSRYSQPSHSGTPERNSIGPVSTCRSWFGGQPHLASISTLLPLPWGLGVDVVHSRNSVLLRDQRAPCLPSVPSQLKPRTWGHLQLKLLKMVNNEGSSWGRGRKTLSISSRWMNSIQRGCDGWVGSGKSGLENQLSWNLQKLEKLVKLPPRFQLSWSPNTQDPHKGFSKPWTAASHNPLPSRACGFGRHSPNVAANFLNCQMPFNFSAICWKAWTILGRKLQSFL